MKNLLQKWVRSNTRPIFFLFGALLGVFSLNAQVDTTFYPPQDSIDPFPLSPRAILSPYKETGNIEVFSTAEFNNQTRVYVRIKGAENLYYGIELTGSTVFYAASQAPGNKWEIDVNLPSNRTGNIVAYEGPRKTVLTTFETSHGTREALEGSSELIKALAEWGANGNQQVPLATHVLDNQGIHPVEKLEFIQFHFYKDALLPTHYINQMPTSHTDFPTDGRGGECNCSFVLRANEAIFPGTKVNGQIEPVYGTTGKIDEGDWEHWRDWSFEGLPRFYQQFSQGKDNAKRDVDAGLSYFRLEHIYLCSNSPNQLPEGCNCEVPVSYKWQYKSSLDAQAQIRSCFLCGDREAETKVDDVVFAYFSDDKERYEELGGGAGSAWAKDSKPEAKIAKLILPVASIALNLAGIAGTKGVKAVVSYAKLVADVTKVVQVLTTPGKPAKDEADIGTIDALGGKSINIFPNTLSEFIVASMTAHSFDNKKRFFTWNRVLSGGYAQATIKGGPLTATGQPNCCVPNMTQYAQATFTNMYPTSNILDHINGNTFVLGSSFPDITDQVGVKWTPATGCGVVVDRSSTGQIPVSANQDNIIIGQDFEQPITFEIYDMSGRLLHWGKQSSNVIGLQNLDLGAGVYVVKILYEGNSTTLRFSHF